VVTMKDNEVSEEHVHLVLSEVLAAVTMCCKGEQFLLPLSP
jgi:hypothetical protein